MSQKQRAKLTGSSQFSPSSACLEMAKYQSTLFSKPGQSGPEFQQWVWTSVFGRLLVGFFIFYLLHTVFFLSDSIDSFVFSRAFEMSALWVQFYSAEGELESKIPQIRRGGVVQQYCTAAVARLVPTWKVWAPGLGCLTRPADVGWPSICCIHCV